MEVTDTAQDQELKSIILELAAEELGPSTYPRLVDAVFSRAGGRDELQALVAHWDSGVGGSISSKTTSGTLEGLGRLILGDLNGAADVLSNHKRSEWACLALIEVLNHQGRSKQARKLADDTYKKAPDHLQFAYAAANGRSRDGDPDGAEEILRALEQQDGASSAYHASRGYQAERQGRYQAAIDSLQQAVEIDPRNYEARFRLGFLLDLHGTSDDDDGEVAISHYEACLDSTPVHTNAVINLGLLYEDKERYHDAIKCFEAVLRHYPTHPRARLYLRDAEACTQMFYDKEQEKKADRHSQVLKIPVSDFELSVRSRNCLQKMNIDTLGDLIMKTEQELLSYKNFGETSLQEIKEMLGQKGLRLGQGLEDQGSEPPSGRNPLEATAPAETLDRSIDELNLSVRSRRCMERLNVHSVRDLINKTEVELMSAKNFGMTSLNEIKMKLKEFGLGLRS